MARKIELEWPSEEIKVVATLLEEEEPELCDLQWENLEEPLKMFCRHPVSTGQEFQIVKPEDIAEMDRLSKHWE